MHSVNRISAARNRQPAGRRTKKKPAHDRRTRHPPLSLNDARNPRSPCVRWHRAYDIPDFEKTPRIRRLRGFEAPLSAPALASAETAIQTSFAQKRDTLQREIKNGKSFEDERRTAAQYTTRAYANAYPIHVDKKGVNPPSFFENLFSFGRAGRSIARPLSPPSARSTAPAMRKREEQLGALDEQLKRAATSRKRRSRSRSSPSRASTNSTSARR